MSSQPTTKVRLVRCPRCRQLLPELPDVSLYKCGGCGTILQAKNRRNESNDAYLHLEETNAVAKTKEKCVSEEREETGSNQDLTPSLSGESSPENKGDCVEHDKSFPDEIDSSTKVDSFKNEDLSAGVGKSMRYDEDGCPLEQNADRFNSRFSQDYDSECSGGKNLSGESPSSSELNHDAVRVSTEVVRQCMEWDDKIPSDECRGRDSAEVGEKEEETKFQYIIPESSENSSRPASTSEVNNDIKIHPISRSLSEENELNTHIGDLSVADQSLLNESIVSVGLVTSDSEQLEHSPSRQNFGRTNSVGTSGSLPLVDPIADLTVKREDMFKSSTSRNYYSYDGSISSYDGSDDQILNHILQARGKFELPETRRFDEEGSASNFMEIQNGSKRPFGHQHNLFEKQPIFHSPDETSYSRPDKMELLRMVYELKDELNRMQFSSDTTNGKFPSVREEKYTPFYYDHLVPEREIPADLSHPMYHTIHNQVQGWPRQCRASRTPFPGDAAHYSRQVNCSCMHCSPRDWQFSPQFPSHGPSHSICSDRLHSRASSSSTPQHYASSEVSFLDDEIKRTHLNEKYQTPQRLVRPIAGGAPFISCYHCTELLQLPAIFLPFEKKYHRLRCNACREVLKFSLLKGSNIVQYVPNNFAPPPSEAENYSDTTSKTNPSRSHPRTNAKPVSCSDDYELSYRSSSTEGPIYKSASVNNYKGHTKTKSILIESQNKNENSSKKHETSGTSKLKNVSAELEVSPLHLLMGYSSVSQVLK